MTASASTAPAQWWVRASGWAILYVAWEVLARVVVRDALLLPPPWRVAQALGAELLRGAFYWHIGYTLGQAILATLIALAVGIPLGALLGRNRWARAAMEAPVDWMRSIPATALFPAMMLFLGIGAQTRVALAAWGSLFVVVITVMYGAARLDDDRLAHWRRAGLRGWSLFRHVVLAESMGAVLGATRVAISTALVLVVVGEMYLGARGGIGYLLVYHQTRYASATMYAMVVVAGVVGWGVNRAFRAVRVVA